MPRKLEQRPVLGNQELRPGRERRLEELLVIGIAARRQAGALAVGQSGIDALRKPPALRDAFGLRPGIERALGEASRQHARELLLAQRIDVELHAPGAPGVA